MSKLPRVLIVEDESIVALELEARLQEMGYPVVGKALNGKEALRLARASSPDLALLDIRMPGEWDGIETARVLREQLAIPAIFLTAYSDRETIERAKAVAPLGYLLKPFDGRTLWPTLEMAWARHVAEQALRENEARLRAVVEGIPDPVSIWRNERLLLANKSFWDLTGYDPGEVGKLRSFGLVAEEDRPLAESRHHSFEKGERVAPLRLRIEARDGTLIPVELFTRRIEIDGDEAELTVARDLRRRLAAKVEAQTADAHFRAILESSLDAIVTTNERGEMVVFNRGAEEVFGYEAKEVLGRSVEMLVPERSKGVHPTYVEEFTEGKREVGMGSHPRVAGLRKNGEVFPAESSLTRVDVGGEIFSTAIFRDVSGRRRLENELNQAQKMDAIGRLASGIAHDFNNTLFGILGCAQLLKLELPEGAPEVEVVDEILGACRRGSDLNRQLLDMGRLGSSDEMAISLDCGIEGMRNLIERTLPAGVEIEVDLGSEDAWIGLDGARLERILLNLVINACDALPRGGSVWVTTRRSGGRALLKVFDDGVGMDEETQRQIFEPFFTSKDKGRGTGLGLAGVYGIVSSVGGTIEVCSSPGEGSTFSLSFPLCEKASDHAVPEPARGTVQPLRQELIFVVEDDALVRRVVVEGLEHSGFEVVNECDGQSALELASALPRSPDLLLSDIDLPGLSGPALAERLRETWPELSVIFITGFGGEASRRLQTRVGAVRDTVLSKPIELDELLTAIRGELDGSPSALD